MHAHITDQRCRALGAAAISAAFKEKLAAAKLDKEIAIVETGCIGLCARAPVVLVEPYGYLYGGVKPDDVDDTQRLLLLQTLRYLVKLQ